MKHINHTIIPILAMLLQTANAQEPLCGTQTLGAKTETEADNAAAFSLAASVNSIIFGESQRQTKIEGTASKKIETTTANTIVKPLDRHNIIFTKGKTEQGWYSKACISVENAYRPYLNELENQVRILKSQTTKTDKNSCPAINETYKSISELERVLNNPSLTNSELQAKYQTLKKEYQSDTTSGVFLEIEENIFGKKSNVMSSKLREIITANNCRVEKNVCKTYGGFTFKINATAYDNKIDIFDYCVARIEADLLNSKNELVFSPSLDSEPMWPIGKLSKPAACEKAFEISVPEIFAKIRDKIGEVCK